MSDQRGSKGLSRRTSFGGVAAAATLPIMARAQAPGEPLGPKGTGAPINSTGVQGLAAAGRLRSDPRSLHLWLPRVRS